MAIEAAVFSIIIGFIRRGQLSRLADIKVKQWWLVFVPAAAIIASLIIRNYTTESVWVPVSGWLHMIATIALLPLLWINIGIPGARWFFAGWVLNLLPIIANSGKMPVSVWATEIAGTPDPYGAALRHVVMSSSTRFNFLADIIPVPSMFDFLRNVISPGDVLMAVGIFLFIQMTMCPRKKTHTSEEGSQSGAAG